MDITFINENTGDYVAEINMPDEIYIGLLAQSDMDGSSLEEYILLVLKEHVDDRISTLEPWDSDY